MKQTAGGSFVYEPRDPTGRETTIYLLRTNNASRCTMYKRLLLSRDATWTVSMYDEDDERPEEHQSSTSQHKRIIIANW